MNPLVCRRAHILCASSLIACCCRWSETRAELSTRRGPSQISGPHSTRAFHAEISSWPPPPPPPVWIMPRVRWCAPDVAGFHPLAYMRSDPRSSINYQKVKKKNKKSRRQQARKHGAMWQSVYAWESLNWRNKCVWQMTSVCVCVII